MGGGTASGCRRRHTDTHIPETYRQTHTRVSREWTTGIPHGPMSVPVFIALFRVLFLHQISAQFAQIRVQFACPGFHRPLWSECSSCIRLGFSLRRLGFSLCVPVFITLFGVLFLHQIRVQIQVSDLVLSLNGWGLGFSLWFSFGSRAPVGAELIARKPAGEAVLAPHHLAHLLYLFFKNISYKITFSKTQCFSP